MACLGNDIVFKDKMCDQLSEFEELRAVNEIYKHGEKIQQEIEQQALNEKKIL